MKTAKTKLDPAVFLKAARLIADDTESCCCWALLDQLREVECIYRYLDFFRFVLEPRHDPENDVFWYETVGPILGDEGTKTARILGLTLCALLLEDGFTLNDFKKKK